MSVTEIQPRFYWGHLVQCDSKNVAEITQCKTSITVNLGCVVPIILSEKCIFTLFITISVAYRHTALPLPHCFITAVRLQCKCV